MMGICRRTLENRIREWNWTRRRTAERPIDLRHAMRGAIIAAATRSGAGGGVTRGSVRKSGRRRISGEAHRREYVGENGRRPGRARARG